MQRSSTFEGVIKATEIPVLDTGAYLAGDESAIFGLAGELRARQQLEPGHHHVVVRIEPDRERLGRHGGASALGHYAASRQSPIDILGPYGLRRPGASRPAAAGPAQRSRMAVWRALKNGFRRYCSTVFLPVMMSTAATMPGMIGNGLPFLSLSSVSLVRTRIR